MPVHHVRDMSDMKIKLEEAASKLVVVDFFATWCGPCKMISPAIEQMSNDLRDDVIFLKVDVDENEDISAEYKVTVMPTFMFFKNKGKLDEFCGANETKMKELIEKYK